MAIIGVVDVAVLLDTSKVGGLAAKALEKAWTDARAQPDDEKREVLADLEVRRANLRKQLLDRARPLIAELAKKKGLEAVIEKGAVVWSSAEDLTAEIIVKVDAQGPLKV